MAIAKAAVAIVGVVGVATATSLALISNNPQPMPEWRPASEDTANTSYSNKYAEHKLNFLVGIDATTPQGKKDNKDWWEWSFKSRYSSEATEGFKEITKWDKLRDACKNAYGAAATVTGTGDSATVSTSDATPVKYKEVDIWKYCSPFSEKPKTIDDVKDTHAPKTAYESSKHGDTGKTQLIAVTYPGNDQFWGYQDSRFANDKETTLSKKSVKEWCSEAYKKASSDTNYGDAVVYKYCSLKGSKTGG